MDDFDPYSLRRADDCSIGFFDANSDHYFSVEIPKDPCRVNQSDLCEVGNFLYNRLEITAIKAPLVEGQKEQNEVLVATIRSDGAIAGKNPPKFVHCMNLYAKHYIEWISNNKSAVS